MRNYFEKLLNVQSLTEDAKQYLFVQLCKHVQITILIACFTAVILMLFEQRKPLLTFLWLAIMLIMQIIRYFLAKLTITDPSRKRRHVFLMVDSITNIWWLSYLFIFGWQTNSIFEYTFRVFLAYIIIVFYLSVMRYNLTSLLTNSAIVFSGVFIYLNLFTQVPIDFKWSMTLLNIFGFFSLIYFGRMSYVLAYEEYGLIKENQQLIKKLDGLLMEDELTRLPNRRYLNAALSKQLLLYDRNHQPFCLAILDVDLFKQVNDTHGHDAGDSVLIKLGQFILNQIRNTDIFGRYGGEEFVIILPSSKLEVAIKVLNKLRINCESKAFMLNDLQLKLTISIGITEVEKLDDESSIIKRADSALYNAKQNGRNRIEVVQSKNHLYSVK